MQENKLPYNSSFPTSSSFPISSELGRHHDLGLATLDRQHRTVALLDNGQVHQSQSRPPITVHIRRR